MKQSIKEQTAAQLWATFNPNQEEAFWGKYQLLLQGKTVDLLAQITPLAATTTNEAINAPPNAGVNIEIPTISKYYSHNKAYRKNAIVGFAFLFLLVSDLAFFNPFSHTLALRIIAPVVALFLPLLLGRVYVYAVDKEGLTINNVFTPNKQKFLWSELSSVEIKAAKEFDEDRKEFKYKFHLIIKSQHTNKYFLFFFPLKVSGMTLEQYCYPVSIDEVAPLVNNLEQNFKGDLTLPDKDLLADHTNLLSIAPQQAPAQLEKVPFMVFLIPTLAVLINHVIYLTLLLLPWFLLAPVWAFLLSLMVFICYTFILNVVRLESRENALVFKKVSTFVAQHFSWGNIHDIILEAKEDTSSSTLDYDYRLVVRAYHVHTVLLSVFYVGISTLQARNFTYPIDKNMAKWLLEEAPIELKNKLVLPPQKALRYIKGLE